jgi:hypothetical protein
MLITILVPGIFDRMPRQRTVDAKRNLRPWVDPTTPERPWIDVHTAARWLKQRPYLIESGLAIDLRASLQNAGFMVVDVILEGHSDDPEGEFLKGLTRELGFRGPGAGSWAAFNDRLWDFLAGADSTPYAVVITGIDGLAERSTYHFVRCIHNLLSLTEGAGLTDSAANRQIEYFFVGDWRV